MERWGLGLSESNGDGVAVAVAVAAVAVAVVVVVLLRFVAVTDCPIVRDAESITELLTSFGSYNNSSNNFTCNNNTNPNGLEI